MDRRPLEAFRVQVASRANYCCEYCRYPDLYSTTSFHLDHIISVKHGGTSTLDNLAYTCPICNWNKGTDIATILADGATVRLYHPRQQVWTEHFVLKEAVISPLSRVGEATVKVLRLNDADRVIERSTLQSSGRYPRA